MPEPLRNRVLTVAPMPPEKCAYALARYSRSPDSIRDSIEWVRTHNSEKFLESFYFQYGHASIADLGHLVICFEGISELAATEIEDEQLWDGQARSSRYQNFGTSGFVTPPELTEEAPVKSYREAGEALLRAYGDVHARMVDYLAEKLPRPADMKPDAYQRNIAARAFDVARYLLFFGVPTGVGQVVSIRTLEKQVRRLKASEYAELRSLGDEVATACAQPPACTWNGAETTEPIAPTLARYVDTDLHAEQSFRDLRQWAEQNLSASMAIDSPTVEVTKPSDTTADVVATLLYPVTNRSFKSLYELACSWSGAQRNEVIQTALRSRTQRDELLRGFRTAPYSFDLAIDIGAYRDLHRHRRCQQFRQAYGGGLGYSEPAAIIDAGLRPAYRAAMDAAFEAINSLNAPASHYLLPFGAKSRFLFKMDLAEAEYICRLRSGVKGHFSYREIAWEMKEKLAELEPDVAAYLSATPPWIEDPLKR